MVKIYGARLVWRVVVVLGVVQMYVKDRTSLAISSGLSLRDGFKPLHLIWLLYAGEMLLKVIPQKITSIGSRKVFKALFEPAADRLSAVQIMAEKQKRNETVKKVFIVWFGSNALLAAGCFARILSESALLLTSLFYYVGDLICVIFFCPFQTVIMKNRCCVTCPIFNWDSLMYCTPLIFIRSFYSWSLVLMALSLFIWWEVAFRKHPQRFLAACNEKLKCANCAEQICKVKRRLQPVWRELAVGDHSQTETVERRL